MIKLLFQKRYLSNKTTNFAKMSINFNDTEAFKAAFNEHAATGNKFIAIFTGSINEETNESWCPDCVQAKPSI